METKKDNEKKNGEIQVRKNLFNVNTELTDVYKKQVDLTLGFINNFFGANLDSSNSNHHSGSSKNLFSDSVEKSMKQIMQFNKNILSGFSDKYKGDGYNQIIDEFKLINKHQLETSAEMMNSIYLNFNKQIEASMNSNIKMVKDMNEQFDLWMKQYKKNAEDIFKIFVEPLNKKEDSTIKSVNKESTKDMSIDQAKKKSLVEV